MIRLTRLLGLSLALLIVVTSQQMAMVRGMTKDTSGQVILCTGQGPTIVTLDSSGNPMRPVHICPDCALALMVFVEAQVVAQVVGLHIQTLPQTPARVLQTPAIPTTTQARGPPPLV